MGDRLYNGPCCNPSCVFKPRPWSKFQPARNTPGKQVCAASACLWAGNRDREKERKQGRERYWRQKEKRDKRIAELEALVLTYEKERDFLKDLCPQSAVSGF